MDLKFDWLNSQVDLMQADQSLDPSTSVAYQPGAEDITMLQVAARLNASRPGAGAPDADFLVRLRARVLDSVRE